MPAWALEGPFFQPRNWLVNDQPAPPKDNLEE